MNKGLFAYRTNRPHGRSHSISQRLLSLFTALSLVLSCVMPLLSGVAIAQSNGANNGSGNDTDPPVIGFDELPEGRRGDTQVFSANVTDDNRVTEVSLYYRTEASNPYTKAAMQPIAGTPIYTVSINDISPGAEEVQYYLEAKDQVGNRTLRGFAFDALKRMLVADRVAAAPAATTEPATSSGGISSGRMVLYGVLGLLAVGALAAAADGGDDSSSGSGADDTTTLTIEVGNPF